MGAFTQNPQKSTKDSENKTNLQLYMGDNAIARLPSQLFELTNLVYLSLRKLVWLISIYFILFVYLLWRIVAV